MEFTGCAEKEADIVFLSLWHQGEMPRAYRNDPGLFSTAFGRARRQLFVVRNCSIFHSRSCIIYGVSRICGQKRFVMALWSSSGLGYFYKA